MHPQPYPTKKKFLRLFGWTSLVLFYAIWLAAETLYRPANPDYVTFWSASQAANQGNYRAVYQAEQLDEYQAVLPPTTGSSLPPAPVPYLPVFLLPYQWFSLLPILPSQWLWRACNLLALGAYLAFFLRKTSPPQKYPPLLALALFSFPTFSNFIWGQSNLWLVICLGEMMRLTLQRKELVGGLWLAGLLLKPQTLILLLPGLVLQRAWKTLLGFGIGASGLLGVSLALGGVEAILALAKLWIGFTTPIALNAPWHMTNWRMVGLQWQALGWAYPNWIWAGIALTALAGISLWRKPLILEPGAFALTMLATLAATCAVAWHAHIHMLVVLLPALLLALTTHSLPEWAGRLWLLAFPVAGVVMWAAAWLASQGHAVPPFLEGTSVLAVCGFGLNLFFVVWALRKNQPGVLR